MGGCIPPYGLELFKNKHGAVFVAWERGGEGSVDHEKRVYELGAAFCSPADFPGSSLSRERWRWKGEAMAWGRLESNSLRRLCVMEIREQLIYGGCNRDVCEPRVVREAILRRLLRPVSREIPSGRFQVDMCRVGVDWGRGVYGKYPHSGQFHHWYRAFLVDLWTYAQLKESYAEAQKVGVSEDRASGEEGPRGAAESGGDPKVVPG